MTIRPAIEEDNRAVRNLWRDMREELAAIDSRMAPAENAGGFAAEYLKWRVDARHPLFVAESQGVVVGYVLGQIHERPTMAVSRIGYVADLYVTPAKRRRGCGRSLYSALSQWFRRNRLTVIELNCSTQNADALAFWRSFGYAEIIKTFHLEIGKG